MKSTAFIRDTTGAIVPLGQTVIRKTWDFLDGAIPAGLEVPAGTVSFASPGILHNGLPLGGFMKVMSAATVDSAASLRTTTAFDTRNFEGFLWEVDGLRFENGGAPFNFTIGLHAAGSIGGYSTQFSTGPSMGLHSGGTAEAINYQKRTNGEGILRSTLGLGMSVRHQELVLFEGDQPVGVRDMTQSTFLNGSIRPSLEVVTKEAVSHGFWISQARLTLWQN